MQHRPFPQLMMRNRRLQRMRTLIHALTVAALLAGVIPPPALTGLANSLLPTMLAKPATELAEALLPEPTIALAASDIPQGGWSVHFVSSEETSSASAPATNAFDGNISTFWHSRYSALQRHFLTKFKLT
ncbi:MAG: hypothetical protein R2867_06555 [Caldilineaceae bacterium]